MTMKRCLFLLALLLCPLWGMAGELPARIFAQTPAPTGGELAAPRLVAIDPAASRCFVLDSGARRVVAFTMDGAQVATWSFEDLGVRTPLPADPLLPIPALGIAQGTAYLLQVDRNARQVSVRALDTAGKTRTVTLPDGAANGAVALDEAGRVVVAYLRQDDGKVTLYLARETDDGTCKMLVTQENPCDGTPMALTLTGFLLTPDGKVALGLAERGAATYGYVRSWLLQGTLQGAEASTLQVAHRFSLFDSQGKVQDRFRAAVTLAGRQGYPGKPCVPLFTALISAPDGSMVSGGHSVDPFLRVYGKDGALLHSLPRAVTGGQSIALWTANGGARIVAIDAAGQQLHTLALDGRVLGTLGTVAPYDLAHPVAIAADKETVYVATRANGGYGLLRFSSSGHLLWTQPLAPPTGMALAQPVLAITASERVLIGWRQPKAAGVGWVDTVMEDGTPGIPLWPEPYVKTSGAARPVCAPLLITGTNGRVYATREMKEGVRVQAYSSAGAFLQQFPASLQGLTLALGPGQLALVRPDATGLVIVPVSPQGTEMGWKRIPRPAEQASFFPALTTGAWGWLTSTDSLLQLDENFTVVDELTVRDQNGLLVDNVAAIAGDGAAKIYLAVPGQILVVEP
ncbi:MAG TPA: hypothetical protein VGL77_17570 [Armatimonadota bacterium]